ncbi:uncharacterized protein LOC121621176 [Chelmon rostratus]|uniref:uncharacterized protein LOC121621176 n=1 Tax=Chelmon rostratus TaxID=109905 RepID=UPI001BEAE731|nr:uncharacterized protein LOC121621176 [Chelmon rostratus]
MCAVWFKLVTILCLSSTALTGPESGGVVWRDFGGSVTIQCRSPDPDQEFLTLKRGLGEDHVLVIENDTSKNTISKEFTGRLQLHGVFPSVDILIRNLTSGDTGPYWCFYSKFDLKSSQSVSKKGSGSVLLVVADTVKKCEPEKQNLVLVSVVISAAVLLGIIMGFLIWIILKTKTLRSTVKKRHVTSNDVYEDMRGTLRR